ncbi:unnamed protein product [Adineta ricciae]|uniref:Cytochrome P450 n=1 Tax=Adineta ricciae TaxID=249248 RepID=A0A814CYW9_ADIRI|nr:unnamed protein product [Adineta ricciae]
MLLLTSALLTLLLIVIVAYLWHIRKAYDFFIKLNIPGPPPTLLFGNFLDIIRSKRLSLSIHEWTKKYGRIYGYYEGHTPVLVVSDPDVLQDVFIKSFSNFHSRRLFPLADPTDKSVNMITAMGLRWKRQRFIINPTFSSSKLKQMTPLVHRSVHALTQKLSEECRKGQPFNISTYLKRFTMDTIWSCGFGIDTDMQNNTANPYLLYSQQVFGDRMQFRLFAVLTIFITELRALWRTLHMSISNSKHWLRYHIPLTQYLIEENPSTWIISQARQMIKKKQEIGRTSRVDLLQLMLESASNEEYIQDGLASNATNEEADIEPPLVRKLTTHEIASNIFLFMIAGYETTSTALSYVSYVLATHPHEQLTLQQHIDTYFNPEREDEMPSYDILSQMNYLDMFIRETLRMYPIAPIVINRQSTEAFDVKGVGVVPVGTCIAVDIYNLHFDAELWGPVDPHTFYPERFETKRHPMAWIPFGAGPRNCVGMRFALMEMKMVLIRLLKTYSVIDCGDQRNTFESKLKEAVVIAPREIRIRLERRHE